MLDEGCIGKICNFYRNEAARQILPSLSIRKGSSTFAEKHENGRESG